MLAVLELIQAIKYLADSDFNKDGSKLLDTTSKIANNSKSIAQMARENICQFPLLVSGNLSTQASIQTANILEQLYTTYIKMVITNNAEILDLTKNQDKKKVLNTIHQNDNANYGLAGFQDYRNAAEQGMGLFQDNALPFNLKNFSKYDLHEACKSLNLLYSENFNLLSLNGNNSKLLNEELSKYDIRSYNSIEIELSKSISRYLKTKNCNELDRIKNLNSLLETLDKRDCVINRKTQSNKELEKIAIEIEKYKSGKKLDDLKIKEYEQKLADANFNKGTYATGVRSDNTIKKNNDAEPSLLEMDITYNNGSTFHSSRFTVGVKTIVHLMPYEELCYYIPESLIKKQLIFRFLQWTTGEIKFLKDFVFDLNNTKDEAITDKKSVKWWRHLKTRRTASRVRSIYSNAFVPNATIVLAREDVEFMKTVNKIDLLNNPSLAGKLMDIFFLLHVVIVDEADDLIYIYNNDTNNWERYNLNKLEKDIKESLKQNKTLALR